MELAALDENERIALCALVMAVVDADAEKTDEEMEEFREIANELGRREFDAALKEATRRFATTPERIAFGKSAVHRPEARQIIHTVLVDIAAVDGISPEESDVIRDVATAWGIRTARDK